MMVRKSTCYDLPTLMEIYREARQIQLDSGNLHQWKDGYPSEDIVRGDIDRGVGCCGTAWRRRGSDIAESSTF